MAYECGPFVFNSNFDSGNLARVEQILPVSTSQDEKLSPRSYSINTVKNTHIDYEFNLWTSPDCSGTPFQNGNRTWFYFSVQGPGKSVLRFNILNLNRQAKLYSQGMRPFYCTLPSHPDWARLPDKPTYKVGDNDFVLSFKFVMPATQEKVFFAFCYPYSYDQLQEDLTALETKFSSSGELYFHRTLLCHSLDCRRVDLITISSHKNVTTESEDSLGLYPDGNRPLKFSNKKYVVLSARVHPGETPSSFVLQGLLNFLLSEDARASALRDKFVFKLIPMLNPDGVARGHYRSDTRGVNLNRVYLNCNASVHPTIDAARKLILYYHFGNEEAIAEKLRELESETVQLESQVQNMHLKDAEAPLSFKNLFPKVETKIEVTEPANESCFAVCKEEDSSCQDTLFELYRQRHLRTCSESSETFDKSGASASDVLGDSKQGTVSFKVPSIPIAIPGSHVRTLSESSTHSKDEPNILDDKGVTEQGEESDLSAKVYDAGIEILPDSVIAKPSLQETGNLFAYIDLHGHASKRGIFIYGNHFKDEALQVESLLLPKLIAINNGDFDFWASNFTEKNMYLKDKRDGLSKEGSGRVAVLKLTGLVRSYTLECNYNMGRVRAKVPPLVLTLDADKSIQQDLPPNSSDLLEAEPWLPPAPYTQDTFLQIGVALGEALLDLTGESPLSRIPASSYRTLEGVRNWLKQHCFHGNSFEQMNAELSASPRFSTPTSMSSSPRKAQSSSPRASVMRSSTARKIFDEPKIDPVTHLTPQESTAVAASLPVPTLSAIATRLDPKAKCKRSQNSRMRKPRRVPWPKREKESKIDPLMTTATTTLLPQPTSSAIAATLSLPVAISPPLSPLAMAKSPKPRIFRRKKMPKAIKGIKKSDSSDGAGSNGSSCSVASVHRANLPRKRRRRCSDNQPNSPVASKTEDGPCKPSLKKKKVVTTSKTRLCKKASPELVTEPDLALMTATEPAPGTSQGIVETAHTDPPKAKRLVKKSKGAQPLAGSEPLATKYGAPMSPPCKVAAPPSPYSPGRKRVMKPKKTLVGVKRKSTPKASTIDTMPPTL